MSWTPPGASPSPKSKTPLVVGIVLGVVVLLGLCGGVAVTGFFLVRDKVTGTGGDTTDTIAGVVNYRENAPDMLTRDHATGTITHSVEPPVGGNHDAVWQNCQGDVYTAPVRDAHAVHSLEHGAVWITYRMSLSPSQIATLAKKVKGTDYTFLSPHASLNDPISLQAWGYQLKVDSADDERIDQFLAKYRVTASMEPGATCGNGTTAVA